jgi:hypothetical protein
MHFISSVKESTSHSDDENSEEIDDDGTKESVYYISEKEGRSTKYMKFYRMVLDKRGRRDQRRRGGHKK